MGIDWGNWRRHPKWKHAFYITAFAQIALLIQRNFTSSSRACGLGCNEVNCRTLLRSTLTPLEVWQELERSQLTAPSLIFHQHSWNPPLRSPTKGQPPNLHFQAAVRHKARGQRSSATALQPPQAVMGKVHEERSSTLLHRNLANSEVIFEFSSHTTQNFPFSPMANKKDTK